MSLINDALKRAESEKLVTITEDECVPELECVPDGPRPGKRLFGPMTLIALLAIGAGWAIYRYWGPGDGPAPQQAAAGPKLPTIPDIAKLPFPPKANPPVNPMFKNLSPAAARRVRTQVAASVVDGLFSSGRALNDYTASLGKPKPGRVRRKPAVATKPAAVPKPSDPPKTDDPPKPKPKPILSAAAAGVKPSTFRINGIMFNGPDSMAIINDSVYRIGQKVSGAVIINITPSSVILEMDGKRFSVGM